MCSSDLRTTTMSDSSTNKLHVSNNASKNPNPVQENATPAHWVNATGCAFQNPWDSWRSHTISDRLSLVNAARNFPSHPKDPATLFPIRTPTWGRSSGDGGKFVEDSYFNEKIKVTWLGHACFFVEFPARVGDRGVRILFDPVFSDRCSPSQWIGPKRYTPPPCKIEDIPEVDAIVISHNHYDHLDTHTIRTLLARSPSRSPHIFAPLGNGPYFKDLGVAASHTHIMDWWDSKRVEVSVAGKDDQPSAVDITCTPGQHFTGRSIFDNFKTLWGSWTIEEVVQDTTSSSRPPVKVFFAGDTGYRAVNDGEDEDQVPVCPAFKQIGDRFGGFDCALIPIGAYLPRQFMSPIHCAPQDSVRLFQDIKAKRAVGMHWATWVLTSEDVLEPPKRLAEECKKLGIDDDAFTVCDIGETLFF